MAFHRDIQPVNPDREESTEKVGGLEEIREVRRSWVVTNGTLACPSCDLPVAVGDGIPVGANVECPWCEHTAPARDFFSSNGPPRPTRVDVIATL